MIRFIFTAVLVLAFLWFGATVSLGKRTLFGHVSNIWSSDEAREMRDDVKETTAPMLDKAKQGAKRGWKAMNASDADAAPGAPDGPGTPGAVDAGADSEAPEGKVGKAGSDTAAGKAGSDTAAGKAGSDTAAGKSGGDGAAGSKP